MIAKKISINPLDPNSVKAAIREIEQFKKTDWFTLFVKASCEWIVERANFYLDVSGLSPKIIQDIKAMWRAPEFISNNAAVLRNAANDGVTFRVNYDSDIDINVLIEFGVGIVGKENQHPMANGQYDYDRNSRYKLKDRSWIFSIQDPEYVDIKSEYVISDRKEHPNTIRTKGQPATMFFHKAVLDFKNFGYRYVADKIL